MGGGGGVKEEYAKIKKPDGMEIAVCPVCASAPELYEFGDNVHAHKLVACSNGDAIGPQKLYGGEINLGCPLFTPPPEFHQERIVDAVNYWNDYARALGALQRKNRWNIYQTLRSNEQEALKNP